MKRKSYNPETFKKLRAEGLSYSKIAAKTGAHISTVVYHLNENARKAMRRHSAEWQKSPKGKKYMAERFKAKYHSDKKFRERHKAYVRAGHKKVEEKRKTKKG